MVGLTNFTELQLYFDSPNTSPTCYVVFKGITLRLRRSDGDELGIGFLSQRMSVYTKNITDGTMWMDSLLAPVNDTYKGMFTFALQTWDEGILSEFTIDDTVVSLDTNIVRKWDGTSWDVVETLAVGTDSNGWYWVVQFFPDYFLVAGRIIWNGATNNWNLYLNQKTASPDEVTLKYNHVNKLEAVGVKVTTTDLGLTEISGDDLVEFMTAEWDL